MLGVGEEKLDNGTKEFLSLMKEKGIKLEKLVALFTDYKYMGFILFCRKSENARNLDFIRIFGIFFL